MAEATDRDIALELAARIKTDLLDPTKEEGSNRPPSDQPPAYAKFLMSESPNAVQWAVGLNARDWEIVSKALEHYGSCGN